MPRIIGSIMKSKEYRKAKADSITATKVTQERRGEIAVALLTHINNSGSIAKPQPMWSFVESLLLIGLEYKEELDREFVVNCSVRGEEYTSLRVKWSLRDLMSKEYEKCLKRTKLDPGVAVFHRFVDALLVTGLGHVSEIKKGEEELRVAG